MIIRRFGKIAAFVLMLLFFLVGCQMKPAVKKQNLEYEVCYDTMLPEELLEIVTEKKQGKFKLTYVTGDSLYIAIGYGEHDRNNLCILVNDLYRTDSAVYIDTTLVSEEKFLEDEGKTKIANYELATDTDGTEMNGTDGKEMNDGRCEDTLTNHGVASMYPYIVIRCEKQDVPVIFSGQ